MICKEVILIEDDYIMEGPIEIEPFDGCDRDVVVDHS